MSEHLDETDDEMLVEEMFDFADGSSRPLQLWHPKPRYMTVVRDSRGRPMYMDMSDPTGR